MSHVLEDTNILHVDPAILMKLDELAPGVRGYTMDVDGDLYVPLIMADHPGEGDVGRYLDTLPRDRTVKIPNVLNGILIGALIRRGFTQYLQWSVDFEEYVEVWVRWDR